MKEQIKTPEKELNKMEISNLSDAEFGTLVIRKLKELSEDLSNIKMIQSEMKDVRNIQRHGKQGPRAKCSTQKSYHFKSKGN